MFARPCYVHFYQPYGHFLAWNMTIHVDDPERSYSEGYSTFLFFGKEKEAFAFPSNPPALPAASVRPSLCAQVLPPSLLCGSFYVFRLAHVSISSFPSALLPCGPVFYCCFKQRFSSSVSHFLFSVNPCSRFRLPPLAPFFVVRILVCTSPSSRSTLSTVLP